MPALPLDEAGKYVAGAYVVFLTLILVYVAIIGAKIARIDRAAVGADAAHGERGMTGELAASSASSHKTAPLALRERLALPAGRATRVLAELTAHEAVHEAVALSTCNRTELYLVTADPVEAETAALGDALRARRDCGPPSCSERSTRCAAARRWSTSSRWPPGWTP